MDSDAEEEFPIDEAKNIQRNIVFQDRKLSDILAEVKTKIPSLDFDDVSNNWISYWQLKQMNKAYFLETAKRLCWALLFVILAYVLIHQPNEFWVNSVMVNHLFPVDLHIEFNVDNFNTL